MYTFPLFKIALWVVMETMQLHITKMDLLLRNIGCLPLSGPTNHKTSVTTVPKEFNVGLITPWVTKLCNGFAFFKFSLIFMKMQMR